jgi:hypothetical protein
MSCRSCSHFCDRPEALERALPGLAVLSSAHSSVRGRDGLCLLYDVLTNGARRCQQFSETAKR